MGQKIVFEIKARVLVDATIYVVAPNETEAKRAVNAGRDIGRVDFENDTVKLDHVHSVEEVE